MKKNILNLLLLIVVNAIGFTMLPLIVVAALKLGRFPHPANGLLLHQMGVWLTVIGPLLSLPAAFASLCYCFCKTEARFWLLATPIYIPVIYTILLLTYFNYID